MVAGGLFAHFITKDISIVNSTLNFNFSLSNSSVARVNPLSVGISGDWVNSYFGGISGKLYIPHNYTFRNVSVNVTVDDLTNTFNYAAGAFGIAYSGANVQVHRSAFQI